MASGRAARSSVLLPSSCSGHSLLPCGGCPTLYTVLYSVHCTVQCTRYCTFYTILYNIHCTVQCTLHCYLLCCNVQCTLYCTLYTEHCTLPCDDCATLQYWPVCSRVYCSSWPTGVNRISSLTKNSGHKSPTAFHYCTALHYITQHIILYYI